MEARLQRPLRGAGHLGDLRERELATAAQDDHLAHEVRQLPQRPGHRLGAAGLVQPRRDAFLARALVGEVEAFLVEGDDRIGAVAELTRSALAEGIAPKAILDDGLIFGMNLWSYQSLPFSRIRINRVKNPARNGMPR